MDSINRGAKRRIVLATHPIVVSEIDDRLGPKYSQDVCGEENKYGRHQVRDRLIGADDVGRTKDC